MPPDAILVDMCFTEIRISSVTSFPPKAFERTVMRSKNPSSKDLASSLGGPGCKVLA